MPQLPFQTLPEAPPTFSGTGVMTRMVDALGFRYRWATEGLPEQARAFRPCEGAMTLGGLLIHIDALTRWMLTLVRGHVEADPRLAQQILAAASGTGEADLTAWQASDDPRTRTLGRLAGLRELLAHLQDGDLAGLSLDEDGGERSVWRLLNGPLADALTHVGQVASWRRMAGCPGPRADLFRGLPPADG